MPWWTADIHITNMLLNIATTSTIEIVEKCLCWRHYGDIIMDAMASQIARLTNIYSTVFLHKSKKISTLRVTGLCAGNSANSPHEWPVTRKMFSFDDAIMVMALKRFSHHCLSSVDSPRCETFLIVKQALTSMSRYCNINASTSRPWFCNTKSFLHEIPW